MAIHGVASARLILRRAALTPVETGPKVFIVGEAERLVPQESSPEAANALLKVIEEPPNDTVFLLTSAEQARMLPTIRSRAVPLRLGRLSDDEVRGFLAEHLEPALDAKTLEHRVRAAQGSIGRALEEDASAARAREAASAFLALIEEGGGRWLEPVMRQATWQARGEFSGMLEALGEILSEKARTGGPTGGWTGERNDRQLVALVRAMERVQETLEQAQGNVNPQLLLSVLAEDLEEALCG
jgi:DNA polymerase-3 subunit delta'